MTKATNTVYGYVNGVYFSNGDTATYFNTREERDAVMAALRAEAIEHGLEPSSAISGIYAVKRPRRDEDEYLESVDVTPRTVYGYVNTVYYSSGDVGTYFATKKERDAAMAAVRAAALSRGLDPSSVASGICAVERASRPGELLAEFAE